MEFINVYFAAFMVMLASLSGVFFLQKNAKDFIDKNLHYLISFSAGVFLIISGHMISESLHISDSYIMTCGFVLLGFVLAWAITKLFPETHHHHDGCCHSHKHTAKKMLIGDSLHNIADGVVLSISFAVSPALGLASLVSIFIHEFLGEISEFFVYKQAGYSVKKALALNFVSASTIFIGVFIGLVITDSAFLKAISIAIASGFFLNLVSTDLLPHRHKVESNKEFIKHLVILFFGLLLMFGVMHALGH